jgi:chaperone required for assembly of F1-ATPase
MKRFYSDVAVVAQQGARGHGAWAIALDGRPVKTPLRQLLALPTAALAQAIAAEWDAQVGDIRPADMPHTGRANAAIDRIAPDRAAFAAPLAAYAGSDLVCYRASTPAALVAAESAAWDPLVAWAQDRLDMALAVTAGIGHTVQPRGLEGRVAALLAAESPFVLAALDSIIRISNSAVIGLAVLHGRLDGEAAFAAGHAEELWQASRWGDDAEAIAARADRRQARLAATGFLALLER